MARVSPPRAVPTPRELLLHSWPGRLFVGSAAAPNVLTLPATTTFQLSLAALAGPIVVNDKMVNAAGQTDIVAINPQAGDNNPVTLNGASTYTGTTTIGAGVNTTGLGIVQLGVSSNALPGASFTSGPFGTGAVVPNNTTVPPNFQVLQR